MMKIKASTIWTHQKYGGDTDEQNNLIYSRTLFSLSTRLLPSESWVYEQVRTHVCATRHQSSETRSHVNHWCGRFEKVNTSDCGQTTCDHVCLKHADIWKEYFWCRLKWGAKIYLPIITAFTKHDGCSAGLRFEGASGTRAEEWSAKTWPP